MKIIKCGKLVIPDGIQNNKYVIIKNGKIAAISNSIAEDQERNVIDLSDKIVGPGLIDIHCHGAVNSDFADGDMAGVSNAAKYHLKMGTTTILATIGSCMPDEMLRAIKTANELKKTIPNIYGVHLEGPYFNTNWYGCHLPEAIRVPQKSEWIKYDEYKNIIKMVTLAPELSGAEEFLKFYQHSNIVFSIGHSNASYDDVIKSIDNGITHSCHIFCAQPKASRKNYILEPGVFESTLMIDELTTEIICDGIHVGPKLVEFICKVKGCDRTALVSDALRGVGCPPGNYAFGPKNGQLCEIIENPRVGVNPDKPGSLASSAIVLSDGIKIYSEKTNLPLDKIWKMASSTPAKILNISNITGAIKEGLNADLLVMNNDFTVHSVYVRGEKIAM